MSSFKILVCFFTITSVFALYHAARAEEAAKKLLTKEACAPLCAAAFGPMTAEDKKTFNSCKSARLCPAFNPHELGESHDNPYILNPFLFNRWIISDAH
jgi:hypothetical protein